MIEIRDARAGDLEAVRALNEAALPQVNSVPAAFLRRCLEEAPYFRVARAPGSAEGERRRAVRPHGFLVGLAPGMDYDSANYRWFSDRYDDFVYIDRIVVAGELRGRGIGRALYEDIERFARARGGPCLLCEVNLRPRNEASLSFHESFGFRSIGTQRTEGGSKTVTLLEKRL